MSTQKEKKIITIDGPAASGKSSLSRNLARKLGWEWVSTGAFYRALGWVAHEKNVDLDSSKDLVELLRKNKVQILPHKIQTEVYVNGDLISPSEIYSEENGTRASKLSRHPEVRTAVLQMQRDCYREPGLIAEGRDCGTVIFPEAQLKIFLEAHPGSRAKRRGEQEKNQDIKELEKQMEARDQQDSSRKAAPMAQAEDAWVLDTSNLSLEEVSQQAFEKASEVFSL